MTVKLRRRNPRYRDLTPGIPYLVIGIEAGDFRLLNDSGRPYLCPHRLFEVIEAHEPHDWVIEYGEEGERYAYPRSLNAPGFFEDFWDNRPKAVRTFWNVLNRRMAAIDRVA